jgi:hypothetical protein
VWQVRGVIDASGLTGLSCPSVSLCVGIDGVGNVLVSGNPSRGPSAWRKEPVDQGGALVGVSCPSVELCVAVDDAGDVVTSQDLQGGRGAWTVTRVDSAGGTAAVSCSSASLCVAVDRAGDAIVSTNPSGGPAAWAVNHIDNQLYYECFHYGTPPCQPALVGVSCPSVSLCVAVDDAGFALGSTEPTSAGPWASFGDWGGDYFGVSCASALLCVGTCPLGVDLGGGGGCNGTTGSYYSTSVVTWDPSSSPSQPTGTGYTTISSSAAGPGGVWCRKGPLCFAADNAGTLAASNQPTGGWTMVYRGRAPIGGVSCPTLSSCFAVDGNGNVLIGRPPLTSRQLGMLLRGHLAPAEHQLRIRTILRHDGYAFPFRAPSPGQLSISWLYSPGANRTPVLIGSAEKAMRSTLAATISVKLNHGGRRLLHTAHRLRLTERATFTPVGGAGVTSVTSFVLTP